MSHTYKLLFVDVDGVLNTTFSHHGLCPRLVERVLEIVEKTGCAIVLSSAWRLSRESREHVKAAFLQAGLPMPISCTPLLKGISYKYTRLEEITGWLRYNTTNVFQNQEKGVPREEEFLSIKGEFHQSDFTLPTRILVTHFVSLDDIDMRLEKYGGKHHRILTEKHFVRTLARTGLSENNVREALVLLGHFPNNQNQSVIKMKCEYCKNDAALRYHAKKNKYFCGTECEQYFNHIEIPPVFVQQ